MLPNWNTKMLPKWFFFLLTQSVVSLDGCTQHSICYCPYCEVVQLSRGQIVERHLKKNKDENNEKSMKHQRLSSYRNYYHK